MTTQFKRDSLLKGPVWAFLNGVALGLTTDDGAEVSEERGAEAIISDQSNVSQGSIMGDVMRKISMSFKALDVDGVARISDFRLAKAATAGTDGYYLQSAYKPGFKTQYKMELVGVLGDGRLRVWRGIVEVETVGAVTMKRKNEAAQQVTFVEVGDAAINAYGRMYDYNAISNALAIDDANTDTSSSAKAGPITLAFNKPIAPSCVDNTNVKLYLTSDADKVAIAGTWAVDYDGSRASGEWSNFKEWKYTPTSALAGTTSHTFAMALECLAMDGSGPAAADTVVTTTGA